MRLKIVVSGINAESKNFEEQTETIEVSKYGARISTHQELKVGAVLSLVRPDTERVSKIKVIFQSPPDPATGLRETGIEFVGADSLWGIQFPPDKSLWI